MKKHKDLKPQPLFPRHTRFSVGDSILSIHDINYRKVKNKNAHVVSWRREPLDKTDFIYTLSDGSTVLERIFFEMVTRDEYVVEKSKNKSTKSSKEIDIYPQLTAGQLTMDHPPNYTKVLFKTSAGLKKIKSSFESRYTDDFKQKNESILDALFDKLNSDRFPTPDRLRWCSESILGCKDNSYSWRATFLMIESAGVRDSSVYASMQFMMACDYASVKWDDWRVYAEQPELAFYVMVRRAKRVNFCNKKACFIINTAKHLAIHYVHRNDDISTKERDRLLKQYCSNPSRQWGEGLPSYILSKIPGDTDLFPDINSIDGSAKVTAIDDFANVLLTAPGIKHKMKNMILWAVYGVQHGVAVDRHVQRWAVSFGMGMAHADDNLLADQLSRAVNSSHYNMINEVSAGFGQLLYCHDVHTDVVEEPRMFADNMNIVDEMEAFLVFIFFSY